MRILCCLGLGLILTAFCSASAGAWSPDPPNVTVNPADVMNGPLVAPGLPSPVAATILTITIRNSANEPMPGLSVEVILASGTPICPGAALTGTTDGSGRVVIPVTAGGCLLGTDGACRIRANGVMVRNYANYRSPDFDGDLVVGLRDLLQFRQGPPCANLDGAGGIDLGDLLLFSSGYVPGHYCP